MLKKRFLIIAVCALGFGVFALPTHSASGASALQTRTSDTGGVRVVVTPKALTPGAASWDFEIVMDTHTKPLSEDLVRSTVLIAGADRRIAPTAWQGDAPGGHHRKGVLKFPVPTKALKTFELRIDAIGGAPRTFRWDVK